MDDEAEAAFLRDASLAAAPASGAAAAAVPGGTGVAFRAPPTPGSFHKRGCPICRTPIQPGPGAWSAGDFFATYVRRAGDRPPTAGSGGRGSDSADRRLAPPLRLLHVADGATAGGGGEAAVGEDVDHMHTHGEQTSSGLLASADAAERGGPARFDLSLGPGDDLRARLARAPAGATVLLRPGTYVAAEGAPVLVLDRELHVYGRGRVTLVSERARDRALSSPPPLQRRFRS